MRSAPLKHREMDGNPCLNLLDFECLCLFSVRLKPFRLRRRFIKFELIEQSVRMVIDQDHFSVRPFSRLLADGVLQKFGIMELWMPGLKGFVFGWIHKQRVI